jgi:hypothetical protein
MADQDDPEVLALHRACIVSWLWGYRMGRAKTDPLSPGWPRGEGWLPVAAYCRTFMREGHHVICTIGEILDTWDRHIIDSSITAASIPSEIHSLAGDYEVMIASGFRVVSSPLRLIAQYNKEHQ